MRPIVRPDSRVTAGNASGVNGGAIALSHPLDMSETRLVLTAIEQRQQTKGTYALTAMCIGVGQGIASIYRRV